jgi:hypothetical protein
MLYDPACHDLAEHFLADVCASPKDAAGLAQAIQDAVENWFAGQHEKECK